MFKNIRVTFQVLAIALMACVSIGAAAQTGFDLADYRGDSDYSHDLFVISSPRGLMQLAELVNQTYPKDFEGKTIRLTDDIDLAAAGSDYADWTPIGSNNGAFKGTFDGDGHRISHLAIRAANPVQKRGLFGVLQDGTIRNLTLDRVTIEAIGGSQPRNVFTGGLVAEVFTSTLENCHVTDTDGTGLISGSNASSQDVTGGLAGFVNGGTINRCSNHAAVKAGQGPLAYTGGLAGVFLSERAPVAVTQCFNTAPVTASAASPSAITGGLTGHLRAERNACSLTDCYNTGDVTGQDNTGGIAGTAASTFSLQAIIRNCYVMARMQGTTNTAGGIVGYAEQTASGAPLVRNCLVLTPSLKGPDNYTHLIAGYAKGATLTNNFFTVPDGNDWGNPDDPNGAPWDGRLDGEPFRTADGASAWRPAVWHFDTTGNKYLPTLVNVDETLQPQTEIPLWHSAAYHQVTLRVDEEIELVNLTAGRIIVNDGGQLALRFYPKNATESRPIELWIDGVKTPYQDYGGEYYLSYLMSDIRTGHAVEIRFADDVSNLQPEKGNRAYGRNGQLVVETTSPQPVQVFSLTGSLVISRAVNGQETFPLHTGIYMVRIGTQVQKVIVTQ